MICPKCNSEIKDGSKFCTNCGEPLSEMQKEIKSSCKNGFPFYSYLLGFLFTLFIVAIPVTIYADNDQQVRNTYNTRSRVLQDKNQQKKVPYYARPRTKQNNTQRNTPYYTRTRTNQGNIRQNSHYNVRSGTKQENDLQQTQSDTLYNDGQYKADSHYASSESSIKNEIIKDKDSPDLKTIRLVVSGEGTTKEEATRVALRSAIEQAFGTFVSSKTDVLNDDVVKDEIATVSSGNIQSYKVLSYVDLGSTKMVNVEAVVSIGNLVSFAESKGMSVELAGATFVMNMKMRELNTQNELIAIDNMFKQLNMMSENTNFFDYKLRTVEPYKANDGRYAIQVIIELYPNKNAVEFYKLFMNTISSLALTDMEIEEYRSANLNVYEYNTFFLKEIGGPERCYLRNELLSHRKSASYEPWLLGCLAYPVIKSMSKFEIVDNLQNRICIGLINQRNLLDKYRTDVELDRVGYYGERGINEKKAIYSMIGVPQGEGFNHKSLESYSLGHESSLDHYYVIRMEDIGKAYQKTRGGYFRPFQLTTTLLYSSESFMKLSSLGIEPTSAINYFE